MILSAFLVCGHGVPGASGPASGQAGFSAGGGGQGVPMGIGSTAGQAGFTYMAPAGHCSPTWQGFSFDPLGLLLSGAAAPAAATAPGTCGRRGGFCSGSALTT